MIHVDYPSNSQVNKAGDIVRSYLSGDLADDEPAVQRAVDIIVVHRASHQYALTKATVGLRSMVRSEGCVVEVSQRLKRMKTIVDKLRREPKMRLAAMQDIGGCRAVLQSIEELRRVEQRLRKNRPPVRSSDYIMSPKESGYRGVHLIVTYRNEGAVDRFIEVQLRTAVMHEWAIAVERLSGTPVGDIKNGRGPTAVLNLFQVVSEAMAIEETGDNVSPTILARIRGASAAARPFLGEAK